MEENMQNEESVETINQTERQEEGAAEEKRSKREILAGYFTATRISFLAIFTALSYVLTIFDFSLLPHTPVSFLKLDFSNVMVMLAGFSLGPVAGVIVAVLKELLHALTFGHTMFIGELANILMVLPYMLIPAIVYKGHKGIKVVIVTLVLGCLAQCLTSMVINYVLNFPAFLWAMGYGSWQDGMRLYEQVWYWALLFNFVKTVIISVITMLVYKPLSRLIKLTNKKFAAVKGRKKTAGK